MKGIVEKIKKLYPEPTIELNFSNPFELLVALILSARCTDKRTNMITKELFKSYSTPKDLAEAPIEEIDKIISSCSMHNTKSKNLKALSETLVKDFNGEVPKSLDKLTKLPGVGRKTANILLSIAYGIPAIGVDTHVKRLAHRIGISKSEKPEEIEEDIKKAVPKEDWIVFYTGLILHGRRVCKAKKPNCDGCPINDTCPKIGVE